MKITVFGLGYVGLVTSACLAKEGHIVTGVEPQQSKVELILSGKSPIVEDGVSDLIKKAVDDGMLSATVDPEQALADCEMAIVCVGTPSRADGSLDTSYVETVARQIGSTLRTRQGDISIVFRSTMLPGTMKAVVLPAITESSGKPVGDGYNLFFHPEFLREGSAVADFYDCPKIVVGEIVSGTADRVFTLYGENVSGERIACDIETAEMVKYCDNLFHALKVTFANEIGRYCNTRGIDSQYVMEIFKRDRKLNISERYLRPGFAFGGSCLPKDLRAFLFSAEESRVHIPMLESLLRSNDRHVDQAVASVVASGARRIGFWGVAFKPGTDDLRESPYLSLFWKLLGYDRQFVVMDSAVSEAALIGQNLSFVEKMIPGFAGFLTNDPEDLMRVELIVLCHPCSDELVRRWAESGISVLDLTGAYSQTCVENVSSVV